MKRTKFIAGALVLSMGLLGTGYAYWTDALSINATVNTGKMNVKFVKDGEATVQTEAKNENGSDIAVAGNAEVKSYNVTEDIITLEVDNIYPGTKITLPYKVINESTIGIKPAVTVTVTDANGKAFDDITLHALLSRTDMANPNNSHGYHNGYEKPHLQEGLKNLYTKAYEKDLNLVEKPFEHKETLTLIAEPKSSDRLPQGETIKIVIKIDWKQHNAN